MKESTQRTVQLWRNTAMMVLIAGCWLLLFIAVLALDRRSALGVAASVIAALALAIGLLPGSFLRRLLDLGARLAGRSRPSIVIALSLGSPLVLLLFWAFGAYTAWDSLGFARRYGLDTGMETPLLPLFIAGASIGLVFFSRNLSTFVRFRRTGRSTLDGTAKIWSSQAGAK